MSYLQKARDFQEMQAQGQTMEAFEKYYADDCKIIEMPTGETRQGKDAQRKAIIDWFESVEEVHGGGTNAITANEDDATTCCEVWFDISFKGAGRMKMEEVAVQQWKGDQIVEERFYYNMPSEG